MSGQYVKFGIKWKKGETDGSMKVKARKEKMFRRYGERIGRVRLVQRDGRVGES